MEKLVQQLLSFPPQSPTESLPEAQYELQIKGLVQILNKTPSKLLNQADKNGTNLLALLNPSVNTLPYLYTLLAHAQLSHESRPRDHSAVLSREIFIDPTEPLWSKIVEFLGCFDSRQVRYAGYEWRKLVEIVARSARKCHKPILAVQPIRDAIFRLDPTSSTLTSSHVLFVRLCLEAKSYCAALPVLDCDILEFPLTTQNLISLTSVLKEPSTSYITSNSGLSARLTYADPLQYHLYGAMVYIGLKRWARALEFLQLVISAPTTYVPSLIMVEAYKKWILVGLLYAGHCPRLPRLINTKTETAYHAIAKPYENMADLYMAGKTQRLRLEFEAALHIWRKDNNTGLLLLVLEASERTAVRNLEKTYSTVSIEQICRHRLIANGQSIDGGTTITPVQIFEVEQKLLAMIASGELRATLSHPSHPSSSTVLDFDVPDPSSTEDIHLAKVDAQVERIQRLNAHIKTLDCKVGLSRDYVNSYLKAKQEADSFAAGGPNNNAGPVSQAMLMRSESGFGVHDGLWMDAANAEILDEDMMADL